MAGSRRSAADTGRIERVLPELVALRRELHAHPETAFQERRTAGLIAERLESWGVEVHRGLARTGVVGTLHGGDGPAIGLRADMDALDLEELGRPAHASTRPGKMHACGHDGHMAMLLGAARLLAENREFSGTVHFLFQPAEENEAGARLLVEDGLFERFPMAAVFGLHNMPGLAAGRFGMRPAMAAADFFELTLAGHGGHGAHPHKSPDPIVAAAQIISAWQTLVSRRTDPLDSAVLSVTSIHGGNSSNVIPAEVKLSGTVRTFREAVQDALESGMRQVVDGIAAAFGIRASFAYDRRYRATIGSAEESGRMLRAMRRTVGAERVDEALPPTMGAEDFGWLLTRCPGAYGMIGNGTDGACGEDLHSPYYDFNDGILAAGVAFWLNLVDEVLGRR